MIPDRVRRSWLVMAVVLAVALPIAITQGAASIPWSISISEWDPSVSEILLGMRLPRIVLALLVGAALAAAGALMQAVTRNPLAGPSLLGLSPGAALALLAALTCADLSPWAMPAVAFLGAAVGAGLVFAVASAGARGATPERLILAGAVVGALLTSITGILVFRLHLAEVLLYWTAGGLGPSSWTQVLTVLPLIASGLLLGWILARPLSILAAGEDTARALGMRVGQVRAGAALAVLLLAGGAVAAAGPVAFVGIIVPNICRRWTGPDLRRLLPLAVLGGAVLVLVADTVARRCAGQFITLPLGVMTAALGAPVMAWIARRGLGRLQ